MIDGNEKKVSSIVFGGLLVVIGVLFILGLIFNQLTMKNLWPLFMLIPVVFMVMALLKEGMKAIGVIIPITILTFLVGYFLWLNFTDWSNVRTTWPNFILAPGLGLLLFFIFDRKIGTLIPAGILISLAVIFYATIIRETQFDMRLAIGILIIGVGVLTIIKTIVENKNKDRIPPEDELEE